MYLFFIRAFNDIDHLTPVVWKMSRGNYPVAVYCLNPEYDIQLDYRLNFLRGLGIPVDYVYRAFNQQLGRWHRILMSFFLWSFAIERKMVSNDRYFLGRTPPAYIYVLISSIIYYIIDYNARCKSQSRITLIIMSK